MVNKLHFAILELMASWMGEEIKEMRTGILARDKKETIDGLFDALGLILAALKCIPRDDRMDGLAELEKQHPGTGSGIRDQVITLAAWADTVTDEEIKIYITHRCDKLCGRLTKR